MCAVWGRFARDSAVQLREFLNEEAYDALWPELKPAGLLLLFLFTLVTGPGRSLSLKLSDTRVYEPQIRARCRVQQGMAARR